MDDLVARGYDRVADAYAQLEGEVEWPRMRWLDDLLRPALFAHRSDASPPTRSL